MRRRALCAASAVSGGGYNVALQVNADNGELGVSVFNYMLTNGIYSPYPAGGDACFWTAKDSDNILLFGSFDGVTLNGARIIHANGYPRKFGDVYTIFNFELTWEGQGRWHYGNLGSNGNVSCYDDD